MKKIFYLIILLVVSIFILNACSNNAYKAAMNNGIESLGEKNYHQSALYFELALKEKKGDKEATSYLQLSKQMLEAIEAAEQKEFELALDKLQAILDDSNTLQTVQDEAQKIKDKIQEEQKLSAYIKEKLIFINEEIEKKNYDIAQKELELLQEKTIEYGMLLSYQSEVEKLKEQVTAALNELQKAETEKAIADAKIEAEEAKNKLEQEKFIKYSGNWGDPNFYSNGGYGLTIEFNDYRNAQLEIFTVQSPPANRIAEIQTKVKFSEEGLAKFTFDDDGWFNEGTGTIQLSNNKVIVNINLTYNDPDASWNIFTGKLTFNRNKVE